MSAFGLDEIESDPDPTGRGVSDTDHDAVHAHEQTSDLRRCDLALIQRDQRDESTCRNRQISANKTSQYLARMELTDAHARDQSRNDVHPDMHAAGLQRTSDGGDDAGDEQRLPPAQPVGGLHARQGAEEATGLKEAVGGADQVGSVGCGIEVEIRDERRLAQRRGDDAGAVAVCHAAERHEDDDLGTPGVSICFNLCGWELGYLTSSRSAEAESAIVTVAVVVLVTSILYTEIVGPRCFGPT